MKCVGLYALQNWFVVLSKTKTLENVDIVL